MFAGHLDFERPNAAATVIERLLAALPAADVARWSDAQIAVANLGSPTLNAAAQPPLRHPAGPVLVGSVRLDNRRQLRAALAPAAAATDLNDLELALAAYLRWGTAAAVKLYGDFAFAVWDPARQSLYAARDAAGVCPFYYRATATSLSFSGHFAPLRAVSERAPGWGWLAANLFDANLDARLPTDVTPLADVMRLPPGHQLVASRGGVATSSWWRPESFAPLASGSPEQLAAELAVLVERSVANRLSTTSTAAHLSGGLDSSAVAATAARIMRDRNQSLRAYFWGEPLAGGSPLPHDERLLVDAVCRQTNIDCHYVAPSLQELARWRLWPLDRRPAGISGRDLPIRQLAVQHGNRVLLSGLGGNRVVSIDGRQNFQRWLSQGRLLRLTREIHAYSRLRAGRSGALLRQLLAERLQRHRSPAKHPFFDWLGEFDAQLWQPAIADRLRAHLPTAAADAGNDLRAYQLHRLSDDSLISALEGWTLAGWERGIAYRFPLLDRRLLEFGLALPADLFLRGGHSRWIFRQSMTATLPKALCWRVVQSEPAVNADRTRLNRAFGERVMRPLLEQMLAARSSLQVLQPSVADRLLSEAGNSTLPIIQYGWWAAALAPVKLEAMFNPCWAQAIDQLVAQLPNE